LGRGQVERRRRDSSIGAGGAERVGDAGDIMDVLITLFYHKKCIGLSKYIEFDIRQKVGHSLHRVA